MVDTDPGFNPFPGLRPFEPEEDYLFFGRDTHLSELLGKLRSNRLVAVIGASGSGKSSLVRAGLLPSLHGGFMVGAGSRWRTALFRPGLSPLRNLSGALAECELGDEVPGAGFGRQEMNEAALRRSTSGLIDLAQAGLEPGENLLIVADQFEEIFRYRQLGQTHDEATAFVQILLEAAAERTSRVFVVLTMRSDYLGDCAQFRHLPEAINTGLYLIPRLTREQRREAIAGPVAVGGAEIAPRLINRLLNETGENPDQLPILQHALMRMWSILPATGENRVLDFEHYDQVGGLREALARHAEETFAELPDDHQRRICTVLFQRLTDKGPDNREVRRPTTVEELCLVATASQAEVCGILDRFRRADRSFLMPQSNIPLGASTLIDISHESLIRGWPRLKEWVDDEYQAAEIYGRLEETSQLFHAGRAGLWGDPDLQFALDWQASTRPTARWAERYGSGFDQAMDFLKRSREARAAALAERERELRSRRRQMQAAIAILAITTIIATLFAILASRAKRTAQQATRTAEQARHRSDRTKQDLRQSTTRNQIASLQLWAKFFDSLKTGKTTRPREQAQAKAIHAVTSQNMGVRNLSLILGNEAVKLDPQNLTARRVLAIETILNHQTTDALMHLEKATQIAPRGADLHLLRALALAENGSIEESRAALLLAEKNCHQFSEIQIPLVPAEIRRLTGHKALYVDGVEFRTLLRFMHGILAAGSDADAFVRWAGNPLKSTGTNDAWFMSANLAWIWFDQAPERYGLLAAEGWAFEQAELFDEADRCYARLAETHAKKPNPSLEAIVEWARYRQAALVSRLSEDHQAELTVEQKNEAEITLEILELVCQSKNEEALAAAKAFIERSPNSSTARMIRCYIFAGLEKWEEVKVDSEFLITAEPSSGLGHRMLARALVLRDPSEPLRAAEHLRKAFDLEPQGDVDTNVLVQAAEALAATDRPAAIKLVQEGLNYPDLAEPAKLNAALARLYLAAEQFKESLQAIDRAIENDPTNRDHLDTRAQIEKASGLAPQDTALHLAAGLSDNAAVHFSSGEVETALSLYLDALNSLDQKDVPRETATGNAFGAILLRISWLIESTADRSKAAELWSSFLGANAFERYRDLVAAEMVRLQKPLTPPAKE